MADVGEVGAKDQSQLRAALDAGIESLSLQQEVTFTLYTRLVLPLDGYVFWVRTDLLGPGSLYNTSPYNKAQFGKPPNIKSPAETLIAKGSLHHATDLRQDETESYSINQIVFTSEIEVRDLNDIGPEQIYMATVGGVRYTFSQRRSFYRQAGIYHYVGNAVYADMDTQIVDKLAGLDTRNVIVSDSLPLWLALNNYAAPYEGGFGNPGVVFYPSFLLPSNLMPEGPFAAVHIPPESTRALAAAPQLGPTLSHSQLCRETVRLTIWGTRNFNAMDLIDCINQYTIDTGAFGLANSPVLRDEKRTQVELLTVAMKKSIEFEINYNQSQARNIARQLILQAIPDFVILQ